jgi:RNA polymerase primary sigma factor
MGKSKFEEAFSQQQQQKVDELVSVAKEQGYITYEEIHEILPMNFDTPEQIDQVLIFLSGLDVQILNQAEVDRSRQDVLKGDGLRPTPKP